jgi:hypothetical protein
VGASALTAAREQWERTATQRGSTRILRILTDGGSRARRGAGTWRHSLQAQDELGTFGIDAESHQQ